MCAGYPKSHFSSRAEFRSGKVDTRQPRLRSINLWRRRRMSVSKVTLSTRYI